MTDANNAIDSIQAHRAQIDALDEKIVALLNERAAHSLAIRALKPDAQLGLFDPKREEEIFERIGEYNQGPLYRDDLQTIYAAILRVSKEMHG
ncbi:MAG: chorismate mutase [Coriobacteriales bacterium]|jgi:chorismate mutase|nr:chorismate mutase [Coriobacteriales bacterium]